MAEEKKGFFKRLVSGLTKTRDNIVKGFRTPFSADIPVLMMIFTRSWRRS